MIIMLMLVVENPHFIRFNFNKLSPMAYHMMLFFSADHYSNQPNSKIYIQRILALDKEKYVKEECIC